MRHVHKTTPVLHAKALTSADQPGTFEAIFAVFGNTDNDREVVDSGAFAESISKALPPVVWSHDWLTPPIGVTLEATELDRQALQDLVPGGVPDEVTGGAYAKARLLVDTEAGEDVPLARHVNAAMKAAGGDGRSALREFSWGGRVVQETIDNGGEGDRPVWHLNAVDLTEWGPCLKGVNPATDLLAVKSDALARAVRLARGELVDGASASDMLAAKALADAGVSTDERLKNVLDSDDLIRLRYMLGLPEDASTEDTLAALRKMPAPAFPPVMSYDQSRLVADVFLT